MNENIIQRIVRLLNEQCKQSKELCDFIGVAQSTFVNWKKRNTEPKPKYLPSIAKFFNVSLDYLITGTEISQRPTPLENEETDIVNKISNFIKDLGIDKELTYNNQPLDVKTCTIFQNALEIAMKTVVLTVEEKSMQ